MKRAAGHQIAERIIMACAEHDLRALKQYRVYRHQQIASRVFDAFFGNTPRANLQQTTNGKTSIGLSIIEEKRP